jgi:Cytochrome c7 and related cytochrome c/Class III cytochrome C family
LRTFQILRAVVFSALLWTVAFGQATQDSPGLPAMKNPPPPREQPLPYSHKTHVALGLECTQCHVNPDPGTQMTFPATEKCMACHTTIAVDKPAIQKLTAFAASGDPIPWDRVYRIPAMILFSHRAHLKAGATCEACHGAVAQRDALFRETVLSMKSCMDCHKAARASNECIVCHEGEI